MKLYKSIYFFLFVLFPVFIFGCAKRPDLSKHSITLDQNYFQSSSIPKDETIRFYPADNTFAKLEAAYYQVKKIQPKSSRIMQLIATDQEPLPAFFAQDKVISKVIKAAYESLTKPKKRSNTLVSKKEILNMNEMIARNFGAGVSKKNNEASEKKVFNIAKWYLMIYYTDQENGFVDREGVKYTPPKINEGIGNDVIGDTLAIILEAMWDGLLDMPVFVKEPGKWITRAGLQPTAHKLKVADEIAIVSPGGEGIEEKELKAIWFLSGLAADQSKALSGAIYRLLGDLQLGVVFIAAHLSVGDNDTLARIVDTIFKVSSKRGVEVASYKVFNKVNRKPGGPVDTPAAKLLEDLEKIYPEKN
jgi:hypothetical protein